MPKPAFWFLAHTRLAEVWSKVSLWMDIISAMDRSAMDRFSWNYADIIVVSSWKIPATFWAGKIFIYSRKFKNHAGKAICEVVWPPPPFSSGKLGEMAAILWGNTGKCLFGPLGWVLPRKQKLLVSRLLTEKHPPLMVFGGKACRLKSAPLTCV